MKALQNIMLWAQYIKNANIPFLPIISIYNVWDYYQFVYNNNEPLKSAFILILPRQVKWLLKSNPDNSVFKDKYTIFIKSCLNRSVSRSPYVSIDYLSIQRFKWFFERKSSAWKYFFWPIIENIKIQIQNSIKLTIQIT